MLVDSEKSALACFLGQLLSCRQAASLTAGAHTAILQLLDLNLYRQQSLVHSGIPEICMLLHSYVSIQFALSGLHLCLVALWPSIDPVGGHGLLVSGGRGFESQRRQVLIFGFPSGYLLWYR